MLGRIVGKFDKCLTDDKGNLIVSFVVCGAERFEAKQCILAINSELASGKDRLKIDVDLFREKRSIQANNYFWQLCDKIAEKLKSTKLEIYRRYIKEQGIFKEVEISEKAADTFIKGWGMHGDGWLVEKMDYSQNQGFVLLHAYYGSSVYNKKQMKRLIDSVIDDCKDLGIETKTPEQIAEMVNLWEVK